MTASIELENYRGFENYRIEGLSRVNLLVGGNNCGKTAILEAVYFLASGGDPAVLSWIASQRGEVALLQDEESAETKAYPTVLHFFHNRRFELNADFFVRGSGGKTDGTVRAVIVDAMELESREHDFLSSLSFLRRADFERDISVGPGFVVCIYGAKGSLEFAWPVGEAGVAPGVPLYGPSIPRSPLRWDLPPQFITTASRNADSMRRIWDSVLEEGREDEVIRAMQILEPDLSGLFFLQGGASNGHRSRSGGVIASFKGSRQRTPLGSHGEGMRRLLALSLALTQCKGGVLLIDEIDTGLHYSVMGDMWRLVVEAARQADVQVFATTHSSDCVRGLSWLCQNYPELGGEVSLQKIEPELDKAVGFDAEQIVLTDQHDIEVR